MSRNDYPRFGISASYPSATSSSAFNSAMAEKLAHHLGANRYELN
jgi:hypothetical protein